MGAQAILAQTRFTQKIIFSLLLSHGQYTDKRCIQCTNG